MEDDFNGEKIAAEFMQRNLKDLLRVGADGYTSLKNEVKLRLSSTYGWGAVTLVAVSTI